MREVVNVADVRYCSENVRCCLGEFNCPPTQFVHVSLCVYPVAKVSTKKKINFLGLDIINCKQRSLK